MDRILFHVFAALSFVAAVAAVTRKNAVAAACWLVVMFFGLSGVYVLLEAYFVAVIQVLVYAGAIMVLFLFVIMLLDLKRDDLEARRGPPLRWVAILLAAGFLGAVAHAIRDAAEKTPIADRLAATLRLPTPPATAPDDPRAPLVVPVAPEPQDLELASRREDDPTFAAPLPIASAGARWWTGEVASASGPARALLLRADADGTPHGWLDANGDGAFTSAEALPSTSVGTEERGDRLGTFALPAPEGAVVEVRVVRHGLGAHPSARAPDGSPRAIGKALFETWLLPFEIVSLLLTGAIFGAVVLTKRRLS